MLFSSKVDKMAFEVKHEDGHARSGTLITAHGKVQTPFFMPVCTKGTPKFVSFTEMESFPYECFIANALLLHFKPGLDTVSKAGGLHSFLNTNMSIFTDSGGFQVLDKKFLIKMTEEGCIFRNPFSGDKESLTPESCMTIQETLGSDVAMCLDDQPHHGKTHASVADAVRRTHDWAKRCRAAHTKEDQLLFGICQGGSYADLRKASLEGLSKLDFDGLAIGGFGIGEPMEDMLSITDQIVKLAPQEKPRYLMGIGSPLEIVEAVSHGVDCFDSAFPTRMGRHGYLFTSTGELHILLARYAQDFSPVDPDCGCEVCKTHTKAYLHHLMRVGEPSGERMASHHNLYFLAQLLEKIRAAVKKGRYSDFKEDFKSRFITPKSSKNKA